VEGEALVSSADLANQPLQLLHRPLVYLEHLIVSYRFGVRVAPIQDRALLDQAQFFLAVKSEWSPDSVRTRLPSVVKAGGVEQLRELVNLQLPGISLIPQPVAPRQVPYTSGCTYFQLEKTPEHWLQLKKSGGIAFHFSGEVPGLELELWAVKG